MSVEPTHARTAPIPHSHGTPVSSIAGWESFRREFIGRMQELHDTLDSYVRHQPNWREPAAASADPHWSEVKRAAGRLAGLVREHDDASRFHRALAKSEPRKWDAGSSFILPVLDALEGRSDRPRPSEHAHLVAQLRRVETWLEGVRPSYDPASARENQGGQIAGFEFEPPREPQPVKASVPAIPRATVPSTVSGGAVASLPQLRDALLRPFYYVRDLVLASLSELARPSPRQALAELQQLLDRGPVCASGRHVDVTAVQHWVDNHRPWLDEESLRQAFELVSAAALSSHQRTTLHDISSKLHVAADPLRPRTGARCRV